MPRPRLHLIYAGFGNVGRRVAGLLAEIGSRLPFDTATLAVLTRHQGREHGATTAEAIAHLCARHSEAARDGRLVVIETTVLDIQAGEPATSHVRAALEGNAHVVTANKGPVAFAHAALANVATEHRRRFLFEGVVMDGIPIFNLVRETLPGVNVEGFRGVINSTTNHILTCLERGESFDAALAQMQAEGIAEADPSLDVDGWDAAAKTAALMNVLMGARVTPHDVARQGIRAITPGDAAAALARGERLRLVASAYRDGGGATRGRVGIESVPATDPLAMLEGQQNALLLRTDVLGDIGILQRDGGLTQTAYAIVTDLAAVSRWQP